MGIYNLKTKTKQYSNTLGNYYTHLIQLHTFHSDVPQVNPQQIYNKRLSSVPVFEYYNNRDPQLQAKHDSCGSMLSRGKTPIIYITVCKDVWDFSIL